MSFQQLVTKAYQTFEEMEVDVTKTARENDFVIVRQSIDRSKEGNVVLRGAFRCQKFGTSKVGSTRTTKTDCQFKLRFCRITETGAYKFTSHHLTHNHPILPNTTRMAATARRLAPGQINTIRSLHANGSSVSTILANIRETTNAVIQKGDLYRTLQFRERTHFDGLTQVQELLSFLSTSNEFLYKIESDNQNRLEGIVFACKRSLEQFTRMSFILLMDATYKTNQFSMPLLLISSVDPFGQSYVVACCLMRSETILSYSAALSNFKLLFEHEVPSVNVVITDQDLSLMRAIQSEFPGATHQLCRWHLQENVKKKFGTNNLINKKFANYTNGQTEEDAETEYIKLVEHLPTDQIAYFRQLYEFRQKYVEAWVAKYRNLGISTTQRAEGMNATLKNHLRAGSSLADLIRALLAMTRTIEESREFREFQMRDRPKVYSPLVSSVQGKVSQHLLDLMEVEYRKMGWTYVESGDEHVVRFIDTYQVSDEGCSCPFFLRNVAPCVHLFKCLGSGAFEMLHPSWIVCDGEVPESAILNGPVQGPQFSAEERVQTEFMSLAANVYARLVDVGGEMGIAFARKFLEMLDRGCPFEQPVIQDPPISRPRGRPRKATRNNFRGK